MRPAQFFICLFLTAVLLEGGARAVSRLRAPEPEPVVPAAVGRFDPLLGWSLQPNAVGVSTRTGVPIEYRINSQGLRDAETSFEKPAGAYRIALVGDSNAFGFGVSAEKTFASILERSLPNLEVINLGVCGYGVDQELLRLRSEGFRYSPDLVLAYVPHFGAERHMYANRYGEAKPRFVFQDGRLELTGSPVVPAVRPAPSLLERSSFLRLLFPRTPPEPMERGKLDPNEVIALGIEIIAAMKNDAAAHGAKFLLVTYTGAIARAAAERDIDVLDVGAAIGSDRFILPDGLRHLNEAGNEALAETIGEYLEAHALLPRRPI